MLTMRALPPLITAPPAPPAWVRPGLASVINLEAPDDERLYACAPRQAVIAAYADSCRDRNTWDYESRYGALARATRYGWVCGDFWCYDHAVALALGLAER